MDTDDTIKKYICILDFEATCWENSKSHEIIEFPSVLLEWSIDNNSPFVIREISRIQIYVKPKKNPTVSKYCFDLTGISQDQVDRGVDLKSALIQHKNWLVNSIGSYDLSNVTIVTCGNWDIKIMLQQDLKNINFTVDKLYSNWVNIKDIFVLITNSKSKKKSMVFMLNHFKLKLEGRHHSGIDDCHNISRIFIKLIELGLTYDVFIKNLQICQ